MALGKMLNIGGVENSLPKTTQNPNRFRVARNVQPASNGRLIPRSSYEKALSQPSDIKRYTHLKEYDSSIFKMAVIDNSGSDEYSYYLDNTLIPKSNYQGDAILGDSDNTSLSVMSFRKNDTLYVFSPVPNSLFKYDGVEITGCGTPQPLFSTASYTGAIQNKRIKVIQHRLDFDGIEPVSETVSFPVPDATTLMTIRTDGLATPITNGNINVTPNTVLTANSNTMNDLFFIGTAAYNSGDRDFTITASDTNIADSFHVGAYVFIGHTDYFVGGIGTIYFSQWQASEVGTNSSVVALRVKSLSPLKLDAENVKLKEWGSNVWVDSSIPDASGAATAALITFGFRKILSVWSSSTLTGNYVFKGYGPAYPESGVATKSFAIDVTTVTSTTLTEVDILRNPLLIGLNLGDWYDVNTKKLCLNTDYSFDSTKFQGMTSYQDQLLWWTEDLVYFSDPTLGGSFEHPSASSFIRVGDSEYGPVVSCCGTNDFLVVSRKEKNYLVTGNLATGNYRVQDIAEIEIGAWCNNGTINIKEMVVMINALGVYFIETGGRVTPAGGKISQNFSIYDGFPFNDDVSFKIQGYSTFPIETPYVDTGLDIAFDEYREYLVFCQRHRTDNNMLVLHTKTGEFYEWDGVHTGKTRGLAFNDGVMYIGTQDPDDYEAVVLSENSDSQTQDYASRAPIKLYSTWLTGGEPSLEKILLQLKMFGYVYESGGNSINVVHFKDWVLTKVTNAEYNPDSATQYSHKKRLNSDKVLAASVGFEVVNEGVTFEIESLEVEFNPIQSGMKK